MGVTGMASSIPFEAYQGSEPYIFISYAHKDKDIVYPLIQSWHEHGYRIWYDEGIDPGNEWPDAIANALNRCFQFVVLITPKSIQSQNVRNEINYALSKKKSFLAIHLEKTELPEGLSLQMGSFQAIMAWKMDDETAWKAIQRGLAAETLAGGKPSASASKLRLSRLRWYRAKKYAFYLIPLIIILIAFLFYFQNFNANSSRPAPDVHPSVSAPSRTPPPANPSMTDTVTSSEPKTETKTNASNTQSDMQESQQSDPTHGVQKTAVPAPVDPHLAKEVEEGLLPEMVVIPAGTFTMGCVEGRDDLIGGCFDNEKPARRVSVKSFQISKTEITVKQFQYFVQQTKYKTTAEQKGTCCIYSGWGKCADRYGASWKNPGYPIMDEHPVNCMSYDDAMAYVEWLRKKTNQPYRLPTEAEWEYAARGGNDQNLFPWGNNIGYNRMNCSMDHCNDSFQRPSPVGSFSPNPFGLFDMHGNLWEWVQDCWHDNYYGAPPTADAWSTAFCEKRLLRGGSWNITPRFLRSARRGKQPPEYREDDIGIRVAMDN